MKTKSFKEYLEQRLDKKEQERLKKEVEQQLKILKHTLSLSELTKEQGKGQE